MDVVKEIINKKNLVLKTLQMVFINKKYWFLVILIIFLFIFAPNLFNNYKLLTGDFCFSLGIQQKLILIFGLLEGAFINNTLITLVLQFVIGLLTGISLSFVHFKYNLNKKIIDKDGFFGSLGALLGLLFGSCASCSLALISLLGAGFVIAFLPFGGVEIMIIAILLLLFSIITSANSILCICKIKLK